VSVRPRMAAGPCAGSARVIAFVALASCLTVGLVLYTMRHRPPAMPADPDHRTGQTASECLSCHGPAAKSPRGPNHPVAEGSCFNCHESA